MKITSLFLIFIFGGLALFVFVLRQIEPSCPNEESAREKRAEDGSESNGPKQQTTKSGKKTANNGIPALDSRQPKAEDTNGSQSGATKQWHEKGWWKKFLCDMRLSDALLVYFTYCLVVVGGFQGWLLWDAGNTSLTTATAALKSADALIAAERAYIFVDVTLDAFETSVLGSQQVGFTKATVNFWNYGKTPAAVTMIRGYFSAQEDVPQELLTFPDSERQLPPAMGIGSNCNYQMILEGKLPLSDWTDVVAANKVVYFLGKMEYGTMMSGRCVTSFCWHMNYLHSGSKITITRESALNKRT